MAKLHYVTCPACKWRYYISQAVFHIKDFACLCPKCKHEFRPEESLGAERDNWTGSPE